MHRARIDEEVAGRMRLLHTLKVPLLLQRNQAVPCCCFLDIDLFGKAQSGNGPTGLRDQAQGFTILRGEYRDAG